MFKAIESWLPLYMTGLIDPYYSIKNNSIIFNHTLFIADNNAVISSLSTFNAKNDNNVYNYPKNKDVINNYKEQFMQLLMNSNHLVKIYINDEIDKKIKEDESEVLVLKTDLPRIMFGFTYSKIIDAFRNYIII